MKYVVEGQLADVDVHPYIDAKKDAPFFYSEYGEFVQEASIVLKFSGRMMLKQAGRTWNDKAAKHRVTITVEAIDG